MGDFFTNFLVRWAGSREDAFPASMLAASQSTSTWGKECLHVNKN